MLACFNQGIQDNMNMNMNNNGLVQAPPHSFQPPMFQNSAFNPYMNMNMNNMNMNNYGQQQQIMESDNPAIVSFAPGRPRPGQIYGNTICSPLNDKNTVISSDQTQSQSQSVIATPSNDTIATNDNNQQFSTIIHPFVVY